MVEVPNGIVMIKKLAVLVESTLQVNSGLRTGRKLISFEMGLFKINTLNIFAVRELDL